MKEGIAQPGMPLSFKGGQKSKRDLVSHYRKKPAVPPFKMKARAARSGERRQ